MKDRLSAKLFLGISGEGFKTLSNFGNGNSKNSQPRGCRRKNTNIYNQSLVDSYYGVVRHVILSIDGKIDKS
ncbi:hypothetical protein BH23THE1_BH23THE1_12290 [soil metagenome]